MKQEALFVETNYRQDIHSPTPRHAHKHYSVHLKLLLKLDTWERIVTWAQTSVTDIFFIAPSQFSVALQEEKWVAPFTCKGMWEREENPLSNDKRKNNSPLPQQNIQLP